MIALSTLAAAATASTGERVHEPSRLPGLGRLAELGDRAIQGCLEVGPCLLQSDPELAKGRPGGLALGAPLAGESSRLLLGLSRLGPQVLEEGAESPELGPDPAQEPLDEGLQGRFLLLRRRSVCGLAPRPELGLDLPADPVDSLVVFLASLRHGGVRLGLQALELGSRLP